MRVSLKRTVEYFDTAPDYRIKVEKVTAGLSHDGADARFKLYSDERLFAGGELFFREPE